MALRNAVRRSITVYSIVYKNAVHEPIIPKRNASAMAVPTQSQPEETKNDYTARLPHQSNWKS